MKRSWIVAVITLFVLVLVAGCGKGKDEGKTEKAQEKAVKAAMAQELSATIVSTSAGRTETMKVYMKPDKYRTDVEKAGSSTIVRRDLNKVWMIMTPQKTYMEMPGVTDEQIKVADEKVKGEVSRKVVGSETIDSHPSTKYEVTAKVDDKVMQTYMWWATDINFPVKHAAIDGSWAMEYRDIKLGGQPDSLFEVPAGYKKMTMPGMPGGMKGKIPGMDAKK
jgi:outer membrane lipoprotein-sorting protein